MRRFAISAFGAVLCLAFSTLFTQEVLSAEKAQRLCLVNSPAELIACRRGDSLYYQQPGLVHGKYLLDFAAQYCDTNFEINIQFPYFVCTQELKRKLPHKKYVEKKWKAICCLPCEGLVKNWTILCQDGNKSVQRMRSVF